MYSLYRFKLIAFAGCYLDCTAHKDTWGVKALLARHLYQFRTGRENTNTSVKKTKIHDREEFFVNTDTEVSGIYR